MGTSLTSSPVGGWEVRASSASLSSFDWRGENSITSSEASAISFSPAAFRSRRSWASTPASSAWAKVGAVSALSAASAAFFSLKRASICGRVRSWYLSTVSPESGGNGMTCVH
jgi:hypothetical protein